MAINVKVVQRPVEDVSYVRATLKGMARTFKHLIDPHKWTTQYPEQKEDISKRWRGTHRMIYERTHSREIGAYGGIAKVVPVFATVLTIVVLSSIGLPGTNGFVSEFLVMVGSFKTFPYFTTVSALGVILAAVYLLWPLQRIIYNPLDKRENLHLRDLNWREIGLLVPVVFVIFWLGLYPKPVLARMVERRPWRHNRSRWRWGRGGRRNPRGARL